MPEEVLVTGAAGFFGAALVRAFALDGGVVTATDRVPAQTYRPRADVPAGRVVYVARELSRERLDELVAEVDLVVHAAALTPASEEGAVGDALLEANLTPIAGLLRAIRTTGRCRRLVYVSSAGVFDQSRDQVLLEDDATGGTSLYGAAKLAAELVIHRYSLLNGIETASVRPTSLFGAGEVPRASRPRTTALARLVDHARRGEPVAIAHPEARTDWLSVDDAADAVVALAASPALGDRAYNLSSGRPRPFAEVVAAVSSVIGIRQDEASEHVVAPGPDRAAVISNERLAGATAWRPRRTLEDGVRDLLESLGHSEAPAPGAVR